MSIRHRSYHLQIIGANQGILRQLPKPFFSCCENCIHRTDCPDYTVARIFGITIGACDMKRWIKTQIKKFDIQEMRLKNC